MPISFQRFGYFAFERSRKTREALNPRKNVSCASPGNPVPIGTTNNDRYTLMLSFFTRHQPAPSIRNVFLAGLGGLLAIGSVGAYSAYAHTPLIMAPFGASCVLLFSLPGSPLSQPANVIGGHFISTLCGMVLRFLFPNEWWAAALGVGLAIALMSALRVTHPPAGADPLVVFTADPDFSFLVFPVLSGASALVAVATLFHRVSGTTFPMRTG